MKLKNIVFTILLLLTILSTNNVHAALNHYESSVQSIQTQIYIPIVATLFDAINGNPVNAIAPQYVTILQQYDNWILIPTWIGEKWINTAARLPHNAQIIALTFDDGPSRHTDRLLDALYERGVPATFFVLGSRVERYPDTARRIVAEGHEIGNHTFGHPFLTRLCADSIYNELIWTSNTIYHTTGVRPSLMRPPYGAHNQTVRNVAAELGYPVIMWSVDTRDWERRNVNAIMSHIVRPNGTLRVRHGHNILMHDIHSTTVDAAIVMVDLLLSHGFTFVTVSELLEHRVGEPIAGQVYN